MVDVVERGNGALPGMGVVRSSCYVWPETRETWAMTSISLMTKASLVVAVLSWPE